MAKRKTANELREEAKQKIAMAEQLELKENALIGSSLRKIAQEHGATPDELVAYVKEHYKSTNFPHEKSDSDSEK